jgi:hypothetical protein
VITDALWQTDIRSKSRENSTINTFERKETLHWECPRGCLVIEKRDALHEHSLNIREQHRRGSVQQSLDVYMNESSRVWSYQE